MIRYSCNHCDTEMGSIPFESAKDTISQLDGADKKSFLSVDLDGGLHIRCICEQCEQSLQTFPDYYTLKKWLQ